MKPVVVQSYGPEVTVAQIRKMQIQTLVDTAEFQHWCLFLREEIAGKTQNPDKSRPIQGRIQSKFKVSSIYQPCLHVLQPLTDPCICSRSSPGPQQIHKEIEFHFQRKGSTSEPLRKALVPAEEKKRWPQPSRHVIKGEQRPGGRRGFPHLSSAGEVQSVCHE